MINIDAFKAYVASKDGFARTNAWQVVLPVLDGFDLITEELNVMCKDVVIPGQQILTNERIVGMRPTKQAYGFAQEDVSLTFHVLNDYRVKEYFDEWTGRIISKNPPYELNYPNEYSANVVIQQIRQGSNNGSVDVPSKVIYTCKLEKAFPTTVNAINLNNEQNGLVELNVQLSYRNWSTT
jgi:hypothetical protein|tara:strand:- start:2236 stop:2778 length:543 start_codon:yes stop_codon:yes gene_type:complete